jgi:hypothetical protein
MKLATSDGLKTAPQPVSIDRPLQIRGIYRDGFNPTHSPQIQERRDANIDGALITLNPLFLRIDIIASGREKLVKRLQVERETEGHRRSRGP